MLKPFNPRELIARIRAVLRRYGKGGNAPAAPDVNDQNIALGKLIVVRPNQIIPRVDLLEKIGRDLNRNMDRVIDVLILRRRRKVEWNPSNSVHLQTRRGQGHIFVTQNSGPTP